jgi:hypothetical protein
MIQSFEEDSYNCDDFRSKLFDIVELAACAGRKVGNLSTRSYEESIIPILKYVP